MNVSIKSAPALCFTFSASSLGLCPSPVSMTVPLLGLCNFYYLSLAFSGLLSLSQCYLPNLTVMCLAIMILQCLGWPALSSSESLWKSLPS